MQMRLCRCDMGVATLKEKVLLDDLTGICMEGSGGLHILAAGEVKLEGQTVNLNGNRGVTIYEGKAVPDLEKFLNAEESAPAPEVIITAAGMVVVGSVTILGAFMAGAVAGAGRIGRRQRKAGRHGKICQESSRRQRRRISDRSQRSDDAGSQPGEGSVAGIRGRLPGEHCSAGTAERRRRDQLGAGDRGRDVLGGDGGAGVERR